MGFARLYQGVHTANQIIFGWQIGIWLAFYFHFCVKDPLMEHIEQISSNPDFEVNYFKYSTVASAIGIGLWLSEIILFIVVNNTFKVP